MSGESHVAHRVSRVARIDFTPSPLHLRSRWPASRALRHCQSDNVLIPGSPKMFSIGLHARLVGRPGRLAGLRKFLEYASKHQGVWFATREEIADHWTNVFPYKAA